LQAKVLYFFGINDNTLPVGLLGGVGVGQFGRIFRGARDAGEGRIEGGGCGRCWQIARGNRSGARGLGGWLDPSAKADGNDEWEFLLIAD
jgi:hypothetical protein